MRLQLFALLLSLSVSCGCETSRTSTRPDSGTPPDSGMADGGSGEQDGGPPLLRTIVCEGETGDGAHRVSHRVLRYADGSATSTCSIRGAEGSASGSGSYSYGETSQPGADCFMELAGTWWRLSLAQDERHSIVDQKRSWLVPCRLHTGT